MYPAKIQERPKAPAPSGQKSARVGPVTRGGRSAILSPESIGRHSQVPGIFDGEPGDPDHLGQVAA